MVEAKTSCSTNYADFSQEVNKAIGKRLRLRRKELGMTQQNVAESVGVSYQHIQKFETGKSRVPPATLILLSQKLQTKISFFFEGLA
jgi:transcriptional regulator with XRE-family HTH domain